MAKLRCSAAEESEDTLNVFHSPTVSSSCLARSDRPRNAAHLVRRSSGRRDHKLCTLSLLGECVYARCPHHRSTTTNTAQPQRVGALLPMPSCLGIGGGTPSGSRQGHPRYSGARRTVRPWVAHTNAQRAKRTCHDAHSFQHTSLPTNMF